jgi:hypothetical protein
MKGVTIESRLEAPLRETQGETTSLSLAIKGINEEGAVSKGSFPKILTHSDDQV